MQRQDFSCVEPVEPLRSRREVVEQRDAADAETLLQRLGVQRPRQIGQLRLPAVGWPGNPQAGIADGRRTGEKIGQQSLEAAVVGAGIALPAHDARPSVDDFGQREQRLGAAEVAAEDHTQTATGAGMWGCGS